MPNVDGPRPSHSISGPTHFARQMTFIKQRQGRKKLHRWRSSWPFPSGPRSTTSDHLDVRSMSYKDRYKLDRRVLSGTKARARVGLYLGPSPVHARSVALVLNVTTGLASPLFHCKFDNLFETVTDISDPIKWQEQAYFVKAPEEAPKEISHAPMTPLMPPAPDVTHVPAAQPSPTPTVNVPLLTDVQANKGAHKEMAPTLPSQNKTPPTEERTSQLQPPLPQARNAAKLIRNYEDLSASEGASSGPCMTFAVLPQASNAIDCATCF